MRDKPIVVHLFDSVNSDQCPVCGSKAWIVDGDGEGKFWLLCVGVNCIETRPLPGHFHIADLGTMPRID